MVSHFVSMSRLHIQVEMPYPMFRLDSVAVTVIDSIFPSFSVPCHSPVKRSREVTNNVGRVCVCVEGVGRKGTWDIF